ncbi:hypothetical protein HDR60_05300 [bacterium]|nr:hypothetical protein [bacterium]
MNFVDDRNKFIKKSKLNNSMNKLILAKTLFKIAGSDELLLNAVANVILNRFLYEYEIDNEITFIKCITDISFLPCWKDLKSMDNICIDNSVFKKCFNFAGFVLSGKLKDDTFSSIRFHRVGEFPSWAIGLKYIKDVSGYLFYNNCD